MNPTEMYKRAFRILGDLERIQTGANVHECTNLRSGILNTMDIFVQTGGLKWGELLQKSMDQADRYILKQALNALLKKNEKSS